MNDITKSDWKLFQERVPEWQEHYMERLIKEYVELLTSPGKASDHFLKYISCMVNHTRDSQKI